VTPDDEPVPRLTVEMIRAALRKGAENSDALQKLLEDDYNRALQTALDLVLR
jgi:hypothetical protein